MCDVHVRGRADAGHTAAPGRADHQTLCFSQCQHTFLPHRCISSRTLASTKLLTTQRHLQSHTHLDGDALTVMLPLSSGVLAPRLQSGTSTKTEIRAIYIWTIPLDPVVVSVHVPYTACGIICSNHFNINFF